MRLLSFVYRFVSNFVFLAVVYFSLNYIEKYQNRAVLAIVVLVYAGMRAGSALRSFYFFQKVERLEIETRRLVNMIGEVPSGPASRKQIVADVSGLRRDAEIKSYIDLFFLAAVVLLCVSKIVTD